MDNKESIDLKILKAIFGIVSSIGSELELEKVCDLIAEKVFKVINCNGCAIILIDEKGVRLQSEIGFGKSIREVEFSREMPLIKYILSTKNKLFIGNIESSYFKYSIPKGEKTTSMICIPIIVKEEVKGIIYIDSKKTNAFSSKHEYFLNILAHEISIAIERALNYEQIKKLTVIDELTGIFNRRKFDIDLKDTLNEAIRYVKSLSLLMIDIDYFKNYNDFHGHQMGDMVLKKMGGVFIENKRSTDRVYRYGGEEFSVICSETNKENARIFAERLREVVEHGKFEGEEKIKPQGNLTISIGVSNFPFDATRIDYLIKYADDALYKAKAEGRNRVKV
ncbi:MAG TPA: sensor domain-containing diguanylate cyclase [Candidatus Hydromicrobium sp.]